MERTWGSRASGSAAMAGNLACGNSKEADGAGAVKVGIRTRDVMIVYFLGSCGGWISVPLSAHSLHTPISPFPPLRQLPARNIHTPLPTLLYSPPLPSHLVPACPVASQVQPHRVLGPGVTPHQPLLHPRGHPPRQLPQQLLRRRCCQIQRRLCVQPQPCYHLSRQHG
jgi:hypothetical protein